MVRSSTPKLIRNHITNVLDENDIALEEGRE